MEHNIDKQFKRQLDQRSIKPNVASWDRLDAMLEVADSQKPAKKRYWLAIAASVVGLLGIGIAVMLSFPATTETQLVLDSNSQTLPKSKIESVDPANSVEPAVVAENTTASNPKNVAVETAVATIKTSHPSKANAKRNDLKTPANVGNVSQETSTQLIANAPQSELKQDKVTEPKTIVIPLSSSKDEVKIAVIEKETPAKKAKKLSIKVDPAKLLASADEDPRTLMQRMYSVASNTGHTVADLLSTRNIEQQ